jgi:hypothetical protein
MPAFELHEALLSFQVSSHEDRFNILREVAILVLRCQGLFGAAF